MQNTWKKSLNEAASHLNAFISDEKQIKKCEEFSNMLISTYKNLGTVFSCGNGGSHCDAMHFAEEMTGKYRKERPPLGALALGDASHITCVSNDYGFEHIFARQFLALSRPGDLLIGLSTSGNSANVIEAFKMARKNNHKTIALLGRDGGKLASMADLSIIVPGETSDRIQELHIKLLHIVIETVERALFPQNY